ncbi:hypothetical protein NQD34_005796 [Periophthalmus magnuspinnatus]|nr:hypothetical protein NQD34_005796 [Periophthalmus magnuspinnatus]
MTEKGNNWIVDWTPPKMSFKDLDHELCYFSLEKEGLEQKCSDSPQLNHISEDLGILHIPQGSSSGTILGRSVRPSHRYRVKVRTHVLRPYEGMPSDWSAPVDWTSHAAVWPVSYWIYIFVAVLVTKVFLVLFIVPACRRKAVLWVESVPSPSKSKVILDIQTVINHKVKLYESYHSKALDMDSVSTCSSYVSFRSNKNPDPSQAEQTQRAEEDEDTEEEEEEAVDEGVWSCENIPVSPLSKGSMTFTGPYILCQSVKPNPEEHIPDQTELSCPDVGRPAAVRTVSLEEGYVRLPSHTLHRSVQDLLSQTRDIEERSIYSTEETQLCLSGDSKTLWPQGGAIQGSGYCQLPPDFTCAQPQIIV